MWGGDIPNSMYNFSIGVFLKHPVLILIVSFKAMSSFFAHTERLYTVLAYTPAGKHRDSAVSSYDV